MRNNKAHPLHIQSCLCHPCLWNCEEYNAQHRKEGQRTGKKGQSNGLGHSLIAFYTIKM